MQKIKLLVFLLLLASCQTESPFPKSNEEKSFKYEIEYLSIPAAAIDSAQIYGHLKKMYEYQDSNYLVYYNLLLKTLDVINLDSKTRYARTAIDFQPDSFGVLNSIYVHNFDSIFFLQKNRLSMGNLKGIYKSFALFSGDDEYRVDDYSNGNFPIYYSKGKVYMPQHCIVLNSEEKEYYQKNIELSLNIQNQNKEELKVAFPTTYQKHYYGFASYPARCFAAGVHVYSFPADPYLYAYDLEKKTIQKHAARSKYQKVELASLKIDKKEEDDDLINQQKLEYWITAGGYGQLIYDPYRTYYYRLFYLPQPLKNKEGEYNTLDDYQISMMVLDTKFNLIEEFLLDTDFHPPLLLCKKGLMSQVKPDNRNDIKFKLMRIN